VDRLAGTFEQRDQNVESAAAEAQRLPVIEQRPLRRNRWNDPKTKVSSYMLESS
jgi:hypothetical protein